MISGDEYGPLMQKSMADGGKMKCTFSDSLDFKFCVFSIYFLFSMQQD